MNPNKSKSSRGLVSVVVPVTCCKHLPETLASIRNQGYPEVETVVVDNVADGDVASIVEAAYLTRVSVHGQPIRKPPLENWNEAVRLSSGRHVLILSDDDILAPNSVSHMMDRITQVGAQVVAGPILFIDPDGVAQSLSPAHPYQEDPWSWLYHRQVGNRASVLSNFLFSRSGFEQVGGFDESGSAWGADNLLLFRLGLLDGRIAGSDRAVLKYRTGHENLTQKYPIRGKLRGYKILIEEYRSTLHSADFSANSFPTKEVIAHLLTVFEKSVVRTTLSQTSLRNLAKTVSEIKKEGFRVRPCEVSRRIKAAFIRSI